MKGIILQQTDIQELETLIRGIIREEFAVYIKPEKNVPNSAQAEELFLNKIEASQLLGVSLPTFSKMLNEGYIKGYLIGRRIKFKKSDLLTSVRSTTRQFLNH